MVRFLTLLINDWWLSTGRPSLTVNADPSSAGEEASAACGACKLGLLVDKLTTNKGMGHRIYLNQLIYLALEFKLSFCL